MSLSVPRAWRPPASTVLRLAWQTPVAVGLAALGVIGVGWHFELVGCLYFAAVTPELCRVDLTEHRLPNALVVPGFAFAATGAVFGWFGDGGSVLIPMVAAVAVGGFFALLAATGGVGMGDVKLAGVLALAGGAASVLIVVGTVVLGFIAAGVVALTRLAARGGTGNIAFGPFLLGGFWASVAALPLLV